MRKTCTAVALAVSITLIFSSAAFGTSTGISGSSTGCNTCHTGGKEPTVAFGGPQTVLPNSTHVYTFSVTSADKAKQTHAGLNISVNAGTLAVVAGQGTQLMNMEITHTGPKQNDAQGVATWQFSWTAPAALGTYRFFGAGNSVDNDGTTAGDLGSARFYRVVVAKDVPEPVTLTLLSTGLIGLVGFGRRRWR